MGRRNEGRGGGVRDWGLGVGGGETHPSEERNMAGPW